MPDPGWGTHPEAHTWHELIVILSGTMTVKTPEGPVLRASGGDMLLYPAGTVHAEASDPADPVSTVFATFNGKSSLRAIEKRSDRSGRCTTLMKWLFARRQEQNDDAEQWKQLCLQLLLAEFDGNAGPCSPADGIRQAERHLACNLHRKIELDELAAVAGLSKFHFLRRFREETGETPMDHLRRLRCEEVRRLLQCTNLTIKEIAAHTGFSDCCSLSRTVKRQFGFSPCELRSPSKRS